MSFSQAMKDDIDWQREINPSSFYLEVAPDITNELQAPELQKFTWEVVSFSESGMSIQMTFDDPAFVSAGLSKDILKATVLDPRLFRSKETDLNFQFLETDEIKLPKIMEDSQLTKIFVGFSENAGYVSTSAICGNAILNILLSGSMHLLWGFINSLQIIGHIPLINVMIPSNVQKFFETVIKISQFNMIPFDETVSSFEESMGIESD